jgi:tRNA1Val (adenine37-N6)-methyltransferase
MDTAPLKLAQGASGYRYNRDSFILADFFDPSGVNFLLDAGSGVGVVSILIGKANPAMKIAAVEINPREAAMSKANARENGLARYHAIAGDVMDCANLFRYLQFDAVVANPPYRKAGTGKLNADPVKAVARHELRMTLGGLVKVSASILREGGSLTLTMVWERRDEYLALLAGHGFHEKRFRQARSFAQSAPIWFLSEASFKTQTQMTEAPPLILKTGEGGDSPEFMRIIAGFMGQDPEGNRRA